MMRISRVVFRNGYIHKKGKTKSDANQPLQKRWTNKHLAFSKVTLYLPCNSPDGCPTVSCFRHILFSSLQIGHSHAEKDFGRLNLFLGLRLNELLQAFSLKRKR